MDERLSIISWDSIVVAKYFLDLTAQEVVAIQQTLSELNLKEIILERHSK